MEAYLRPITNKQKKENITNLVGPRANWEIFHFWGSSWTFSSKVKAVFTFFKTFFMVNWVILIQFFSIPLEHSNHKILYSNLRAHLYKHFFPMSKWSNTFTQQWIYWEELGVRYLAEWYCSLQTGAARDDTTNLPISTSNFIQKMEYHLQMWTS